MKEDYGYIYRRCWYFSRDDLCMPPVIANAALYWTDSILLERDSLRG